MDKQNSTPTRHGDGSRSTVYTRESVHTHADVPLAQRKYSFRCTSCYSCCWPLLRQLTAAAKMTQLLPQTEINWQALLQ